MSEFQTDLQKLLIANGQEHILAAFPHLTGEHNVGKQILALNIPNIIQNYRDAKNSKPKSGSILPVDGIKLDDPSLKALCESLGW